ncbi:MAG: LD-carboxypeptidase [Desulfobacterales bacterium]|nr:LD-carboxypeptidase [Desulfobacterales bacterium]
MTIIKPPKLKKNDTIAIVPLASPVFRPSALLEGKKTLESMGFNVRIAETECRRYLAGTDNERADAFHRLIRDPSVNAIMSARGGYGSGRLLPLLDYTLIKKHPKIIIGSSDITSVLTAVTKVTGLVTFYGPMLGSDFLHNASHYTCDDFKQVLSEKAVPHHITRCPGSAGPLVICSGSAEGTLFGGCLTLLNYSLGTPFEIDTRDKLLFIEDVGEAPYRIDGMLTHLLNAGKLQECAGILVGEMVDCDPPKFSTEYSMGSFHWEEVLYDRLAGLGIPVMANLCFGHGRHKATLPLGVKARMDTEVLTLSLIEPAVS